MSRVSITLVPPDHESPDRADIVRCGERVGPAKLPPFVLRVIEPLLDGCCPRRRARRRDVFTVELITSTETPIYIVERAAYGINS